MDWDILSHSHHHRIMGSLSTVDPLHLAGFAAIFSYSFLLSWHCAGMCGPLACSILGRHARPTFLAGILYNVGRCISYVCAGLMFGLIGQSMGQISYAIGQILVRVVGCLLILWALLPSRFWKRLLPDMSSLWMPRLQRFISSRASTWQPLLLGFITIFLPCMTLHPMLLASAGSESALFGGITMLAFYLGTLPVMQTLLFVPRAINHRLPPLVIAMGGRCLLILAGIMTVARSFST